MLFDTTYTPKITFLIPTYNEKKAIGLKLRNLLKLNYPPSLIQYIVIDSASIDGTADEVRSFIATHTEMKIQLLEENIRKGKSAALNHALQYATGDVVIVSDADCYLPPEILRQTLPFLVNPDVGAIAGKEMLLNRDQSWVTRTEQAYRNSVSTIRVGESKVHSTIIFEGGFGMYKKEFLQGFDIEGADDSGTALDLVQRNHRTILVPQALFYTVFPQNWLGKITIKIRRAGQLIQIWLKCLTFLTRGELRLPKRIVLPEVFLYIINPILFLILLFFTGIVIIQYPLLILLFFLLLIPQVRLMVIEMIQNNGILFGALLTTVFKRRFVIWQKADNSRSNLDESLLKNLELV
ncbi:glycosyltransferase [Candidatus Bathyarchaeota archaeon]|nr:glycosyltransferase [Candidatus Bathyarchaeota archaeon]